jgi:oligopeptidase A
VFDGSYAAGYYSYLWAEVLAADVFEEFKANGVFDRSTGLRYLHEVLEVGSSRPMQESFRAFRGRDPDPKMLLRKYGLSAT